uniref:(northern house mosquito) hypothetical protein n=1 Tax=Culex pipiens TaxID=7175 RepID=A0A8D8BAG9_CULPI
MRCKRSTTPGSTACSVRSGSKPKVASNGTSSRSTCARPPSPSPARTVRKRSRTLNRWPSTSGTCTGFGPASSANRAASNFRPIWHGSSTGGRPTGKISSSGSGSVGIVCRCLTPWRNARRTMRKCTKRSFDHGIVVLRNYLYYIAEDKNCLN